MIGVNDGQGKLTRAEVNGVVTLYVSPNYVVEIDDTVETSQKYYAFGSMRVAMRTIEGETDTLQWMLSDHLGSTSIVANADGSYFSELRYTAFGEMRFSYNITPTDYRYTGQLAQAEVGLYYYRARWYDPELGRFVQADTIVPGDRSVFSPLVVSYNEVTLLNQLIRENRARFTHMQLEPQHAPTNPLAFDRYSYSYNNPLVYSDPDGHFAFLIPFLVGGAIGGGISTAIYLGSAWATGNEVSWAGAASAFAGGAVAGLVSVIATPLAGTLLGYFGIAATGTALTAGAAVVNAAGGAAAYFTGGYTQNAIEIASGNTPTFYPTLNGVLFNAAMAGVLSPIVGSGLPVANNTMRTLRQASHFMPGRTIATIFATQNARNMYSQALIATGVAAIGGTQYSMVVIN